MRILVAEDNVAQAESLALCLQLEGHEPFVAGDGTQARQQAEVHRIEAAIIDLRMPGGGGRDLLDWLWGRPETAKVPVVISTGLSEEKVADLEALPGVRVLQKPYTIDLLLETLAELARAGEVP
jgi:CheY-like chemotaxis protein